jgi:hypothetical protein
LCALSASPCLVHNEVCGAAAHRLSASLSASRPAANCICGLPGAHELPEFLVDDV